MKVVLAEKPSVARELASFLGASARRDGYFEGQGYQVTWALGHLATLKEPQDYDPALKKWSLARLPFVPDRFGLKLIDNGGSKKQFGVIKRLFREADELICATDAGREGELIFRYIQELAGSIGKPARRLWLSSLTESAIRDAFNRLKPLSDFDDLYAAARCRSEADWVVGLNATRFYTVRYRSGRQLWSVGRVQTPVLAMIARRDDEIRGFQPEPFWELLTSYRGVTFKYAKDRFVQEADALAILDQVRDQPFTIRGVERKPERMLPPQLHDLTDLQREMNRRFGMSADATLKAAQSLYEAKLISYPRTDSRHLGHDLKSKIPGILKDLHALMPKEIDRLDLDRLPFSARIIDDARVGDHHAIIPTGKTPGNLAPATRKVFDAIVVRLIAAFYPACVKEVTTVEGESAKVPFRARGVRVVDPGWTILVPRKPDPKAKEDEQDLPEFRPGESGPHDPSVRRGETAPPKPFTEGTLLGAMETAGKMVDDEALREALKERGLGTPATRASIIETLLARGYIIREAKNLAATDLGRYLVALVRDRALKSPELTGDWEAKLREVERGRLAPGKFMEEIIRYTNEVIRSGDAPTFDPARLGDCPRCGRPVIEGKRGYGCSAWREGCKFVLWREHQGRTLTVDEVRQLLQSGVLWPTGDSGKRVLQLLESGVLTEIPVPTEGDRMPVGRSSRKPAGTRRFKANAKASSAEPEPDRPPVEGFAASSIGPCPVCGSAVVEQPKSFGCGGWKRGCKFTIWKKIAGKRITLKVAQALLKDGKSSKIKGFTSRSGQEFEARLKVEAGEIRFDFGT